MGRTWGSWEINDNIKLAVGTCAMILSFCLFLSPVKTFYKIIKEKTTSEFSAMPYQMTFFNCTMWILYTAYEGGLLSAFITNVVGIVIETTYLLIFLRYTPLKRRFGYQMLAGFVLAGAVTAVVNVPSLDVTVTSEQNFPAFALGLLATVFNVLMYGAPLSVLALVIRTRSVEFMPFALSFFTLINSATWLSYGIYVGDIWVSIPNACGVVLGIIQLVIYAVYANAEPYDELGGGDAEAPEGSPSQKQARRQLKQPFADGES